MGLGKSRHSPHSIATKPKIESQQIDLLDIRTYEPVFRHRSRTEHRIREKCKVETIDQLEAAKIKFYTSYFLKKRERLRNIGVNAFKDKHATRIITDYLTVGFRDLPSHLINDQRDVALAKKTLSRAASAWNQHLKRSEFNKQKQISIFISENLYKRIMKALSNRNKNPRSGPRVSQNQIIEEALDRKFTPQLYTSSPNKESPVHNNASTDSP